MRQFWAGAAMTALLTVLGSGVVAGKVYVPVSTSSSGLAEAAAPQQAPTATPSPSPTPAVLTLNDPRNSERPVDGPLAIALSGVMVPGNADDDSRLNPYAPRCSCLDVVVTLTYDGAPVAGATLFDPTRTWVSQGTTNAQGQVTSRTYRASYGNTNFVRGQTFYFDYGAKYRGRSVAITKRILVQ